MFLFSRFLDEMGSPMIAYGHEAGKGAERRCCDRCRHVRKTSDPNTELHGWRKLYMYENRRRDTVRPESCALRRGDLSSAGFYLGVVQGDPNACRRKTRHAPYHSGNTYHVKVSSGTTAIAYKTPSLEPTSFIRFPPHYGWSPLRHTTVLPASPPMVGG